MVITSKNKPKRILPQWMTDYQVQNPIAQSVSLTNLMTREVVELTSSSTVPLQTIQATLQPKPKVIASTLPLKTIKNSF